MPYYLIQSNVYLLYKPVKINMFYIYIEIAQTLVYPITSSE